MTFDASVSYISFLPQSRENGDLFFLNKRQISTAVICNATLGIEKP